MTCQTCSLAQNAAAIEAEHFKASQAAWVKLFAVFDRDPSGMGKNIKKTFRMFDTDGSGEINVSELSSGIKSVGVQLTTGEVLERDP